MQCAGKKHSSTIFSSNPIPHQAVLKKAAQKKVPQDPVQVPVEWMVEWKRRREAISANDQYRNYFHKAEATQIGTFVSRLPALLTGEKMTAALSVAARLNFQTCGYAAAKVNP